MTAATARQPAAGRAYALFTIFLQQNNLPTQAGISDECLIRPDWDEAQLQ
jgi:hypothetical protein